MPVQYCTHYHVRYKQLLHVAGDSGETMDQVRREVRRLDQREETMVVMEQVAELVAENGKCGKTHSQREWVSGHYLLTTFDGCEVGLDCGE
jgi:hypothetical protein